MTKAIVHMDLDSFYASCEQRENTALKDIPLIVGGSRQRGIVISASKEARHFGVKTAMPMHLALKVCPQAKVLKGDFDLYSKCSNEVTQIIQEQAPIMEKASIDEFYLDISGMDRYFGCLKWTQELIDAITKETRLPTSFGLSVNKTISKMATNEAKPLGKLKVTQDEVKPFIDPLSVKKIPGIGNATFQILSRIGIRKIKTLAEVPPVMLEKLLGKNGSALSLKANGIDHTPIKPYSERKSISTERTFHHDTINLYVLKTMLTNMVEKLCFQLRDEQWLTGNVSVKIRYTNFDTHTKQCHLHHTSSDHVILQAVKGLFESVYDRRMRLRLVGVRFSKLVRGWHQIDLFEDTEDMLSLYEAMDHIKKRFHPNAVMRGSGFGLNNSLRDVA